MSQAYRRACDRHGQRHVYELTLPDPGFLVISGCSLVHADFVGIHPFVDGNGRTSRLLMNLELMKAGFPPLILPVEIRLEYYTALDAAHTTRDYAPFLSLITRMAEAAFVPYWQALGVTP